MTDKTKETTKGGQHPQSISGSPGSMDATGPALGTYIVATGTVTGSTLVTTAETTTVLPAEALVGQIAAMSADASQFTVTTHNQVDGDHAEHGGEHSKDATTMILTGSSVAGPAVASTEYVVVPGKSTDHEMLAAKIYIFTTTPTLAAGSVTAADPTTKSLTVDAEGAEHDGQEKANQKDGSNPQVTVDASTAELIVKGAAPTALAPGAARRPGG